MLRVALDTNCWIDAVRSCSQAFEPLQRILKARDLGMIELMESRQRLYKEVTEYVREEFNRADALQDGKALACMALNLGRVQTVVSRG